MKVWRGTKIPADAHKALNVENLLNLSGIYDDQRAPTIRWSTIIGIWS